MSDVELHKDLRSGVRELCRSFPDTYWRELDARRGYPDTFVKALTDAGYLAALIPEEFGGSGLGVACLWAWRGRHCPIVSIPQPRPCAQSPLRSSGSAAGS